jgi:SH3-like domain-containing protein
MLKPFTAAACLWASVAQAQPAGLSGQEITQLIAGATVELHTPLGTRLPIRYTVDGKITGQARDLASYLGAATDTGRWWVTSGQLCHRWSQWFDSKPQCVRLSKEGRTFHWRNQDGHSGTAVIAVPPASIQTASVLPHAQIETRARMAPEPRPTESLIAAQPAETHTGTDQSLEAAEERLVWNSPAADATIAQMPKTVDETSPHGRPERRPSARPAYRVVNIAHNDVLNVRNGPSTAFDVVGELRPGSRGIAITGTCRSEWCPVQHQSTRGWVNRMYLTPNSDD